MTKTNPPITPGKAGDALLTELASIVAKVDAAEAACPIRSGRNSRDTCPKCGATTRDPCGPVVSAEYSAVQGVRAILARGGSNEE